MPDPQTIGNFISQVGFPVAAAAGLAMALFLVGRWCARKADFLIDHVAGEVSATRTQVDEAKKQLDRIEPKLDAALRAPLAR